MKLENLSYTSKNVIKVDINGATCFVPTVPKQADYNDIQKAIAAKEIPAIEPFKE